MDRTWPDGFRLGSRLECYCVAREEQIRHGKTNEQAATIILLVCGFVASLHVLFFAAIGLNTINIPTTVDVQGVISLTD